jgi:hypothetical protein
MLGIFEKFSFENALSKILKNYCMKYKYAVFISYKWNGEYDEWVNEIFYPIVQEFFISRFNKDLVFKDTKESRKAYGNSVIDILKEGLIRSMCMVAVLNGPYFCSSAWCPKEFSVMFYRHKKYNNEPPPKRLLFPVIFTNSENKSTLLQVCPGLAAFIENSFMPLFLEEEKYLFTNQSFKQSDGYNALKLKIKEFLNDSVLPAIQIAPAWSNEWGTKEWFDDPVNDFSSKIDCIEFFKQPLMT